MRRVTIMETTKSAAQSGQGKSGLWEMIFESSEVLTKNPLMGWDASEGPESPPLTFRTEEEALNYARQKGYGYTLIKKSTLNLKPKSYADNFRKSPLSSKL